MKGNKTKVSASQSQVTDYELQRLQRLKCNAERMSAQGSGSLANKILQQKTKDLLSPSVRQTEDDSTSEYDGEEEGETMEDDSLASGKRKVIESTFQQEKSQAGSLDSLSKHALVEKGQVTAITALKELRNISNLLREM